MAPMTLPLRTVVKMDKTGSMMKKRRTKTMVGTRKARFRLMSSLNDLVSPNLPQLLSCMMLSSHFLAQPRSLYFLLSVGKWCVRYVRTHRLFGVLRNFIVTAVALGFERPVCASREGPSRR